MGRLLFYCAPEFGHMNIAIALGKAILDRNEGHEVFFVGDTLWQSMLGGIDGRFQVKVLNAPPPPLTDDGRRGVPVPQQLIELTHPYGNLPREDRNRLFADLLIKILHFCESVQPELDRIVDEVKPNLILIDHFALQPNLINKGIPWSHLFSVTPNIFRHPSMPPPLVQASSLDDSTWPAKCEEYMRTYGRVHEVHNAWMTRCGVKCPPTGCFYFESPYFNVYMYPRELDFQVKLPGNWSRIDVPIRPHKFEEIKLKDNFKALPGKLLYLSMGSFLSLNVDLMQRLADVVADIPHKFIVSAGPMLEQIRFPPNCYAQVFVDQRTVLQNVDLMITHCGNNSTCECFYFGVRMVPMPVYGDQPDNAIRMHELGYSVPALDPFKVTTNELLTAINNTFQLEFPCGRTTDSATTRFDALSDKVASYLN